MTDLRKAAEMALEALEISAPVFSPHIFVQALKALRQALAQPEQWDTNDMALLPCPVCNSPVKIDSTGASEMYGHAWQTLYVTCTQTNDEHCAMSLDLEADFDYINDASDALIECWNILARNKK